MVDSFGDSKFSGYVEQVGEEAEFYPRNVQSRTDREHQVFPIKVHIDSKDGKLKSGMSAEVTLEAKD
jgi:HlyD family secretion protein